MSVSSSPLGESSSEAPNPEVVQTAARLRTDADLRERTRQILQDLQVTVDEQRELIGRMSASLGEPLDPRLTTVAYLLDIAKTAGFITEADYNAAVARLPGGGGVLAPSGGPAAPERAALTDFTSLVVEPGGTAQLGGQRITLDYLRTLILRERNVNQLAAALRGLETRSLRLDAEWQQLGSYNIQVQQSASRLRYAVLHGQLHPRTAAAYQRQVNEANRYVAARARALTAEARQVRGIIAELSPRVPEAMRPRRVVVVPPDRRRRF